MLVIDKKKFDKLLALNNTNQTDLAKKAGLTQPTVNNIVNGKTKPQIKTIGKICEVLGCEPKDLYKEVKDKR